MKLCSWMWLFRAVLLTAILIAGIVDDGFGRSDLLVVIAMVVSAVLFVWSRRVPAIDRPLTVLDSVLLIGLAVAGLTPPAALAIGIIILAQAAAFRPIYAAAAYVGVVSTIAVLYTTRDHTPHAGLSALALCLLGGILVVRAVRLNMAARSGDERDRLIAGSIDAMIWEELPEGGYRMSDSSERILGYPAKAWLDPEFLASVVHPDDLPAAEADPDPDNPLPTTFRVRDSSGRWRWVENHLTSIRDIHGRHRSFAGITVDRTREIEAEHDVRAFGRLVKGSPVGHMLLGCAGDGSMKVTAANDAATAIIGRTDRLVGRSLDELTNGDASVRELFGLLRSVASGAREKGQMEYHGGDGHVFQATVRSLTDDSCSIDFLDITERVESHRRLHEQARCDDLTGLPNRRALTEYLDAHIARDAAAPLALLSMDLTAFKEINEALGHETGDLLLRQISDRVRESCPAGDGYAVRKGGDEFAVVLTGQAVDRAEAVAASLVDGITRPVLIDGLRLRVGVSVGIARYPSDAESGAEVLRRADIALYRAKQRGLTVEVYEPDSDPLSRGRLALVADLESAIARDELTLHHQPVINVASGRMVGSEALCRWFHPTAGPVSPELFVELAESSGQIRDLTRWVLRRAIADLAASLEVDPNFRTSVNLSVRNLYEAELVPAILGMLAAAGVAPDRLILEITEGGLMDDQAAAIETLQALRDAGIGVWIDDFGTGHSSFARLRSLPIDGVKIDRSFVSGAAADPEGVLLASMIELVHALGLRVVAEGVETDEQFELLGRFGSDSAQGYLLGRPAPVEDLHTRLAGASTNGSRPATADPATLAAPRVPGR